MQKMAGHKKGALKRVRLFLVNSLSGLEFVCVFAQILGNALWIGVHAGIAFLPAGRTYFAVGFVELQRVDHAQHFVNITAQRQIVDDLVTHQAGFIDQETTTVSNADG